MSLFETVNGLDAALVAEAWNVERARERNKAACPVCSSSDALHIYADNGQRQGRGFYCHSCGVALSNVDLVMSLDGLDAKQAAVELAARFSLPIEDGHEALYFKPKRARPVLPPPPPPPQTEVSLSALWGEMTLGSQACEYLQQRGINAECAHDMGVRSIESMSQLRAIFGALSLEDQLRLGLKRWDKERQRHQPVVWDVPFLVLPYTEPCVLLDEEMEHGPEQIVAIRFAPFGEYRARYPKLKYLSPYEQRPFVPYAAWQIEGARSMGSPLFVVEGELNALTLQQHGLPTIATAGASSWMSTWLEFMEGLSTIILLCDGDAAGAGWSQTIQEDAIRLYGVYQGMERVKSFTLPKGLDVNDLEQRGELVDFLRGLDLLLGGDAP